MRKRFYRESSPCAYLVLFLRIIFVINGRVRNDIVIRVGYPNEFEKLDRRKPAPSLRGPANILRINSVTCSLLCHYTLHSPTHCEQLIKFALGGFIFQLLIISIRLDRNLEYLANKAMKIVDALQGKCFSNMFCRHRVTLQVLSVMDLEFGIQKGIEYSTLK